MRSRFRAMALTATTLFAAGLGAAVPATAATPAPPTLITTNYACANGACEIGPGNVGLPFAAGVIGTGGPTYYGPECNPYTMKVIAGSLPPGLTFGEPVCEWVVTGTPTQAGTYSFTVQITPQPDSLGQIPGPSGTAQLTVTIGNGAADRLAHVTSAYNGHQSRLYVAGYDANITTQYSVTLTSTGKVLIPPTAAGNRGAYNSDGSWQLSANINDPCGARNSCNLTVTDNLGSTVTVTLPPASY